VNCHAHFDKAYLSTPQNLSLGHLSLEQKWHYFKKLKSGYTRDDLYTRMARATELMISQGVRAVLTHVDVDSSIKLLAVKVAKEIQQTYKDRITILIASQALQGILEKRERQWFEKACELVDVIGGLPGRDWPRKAEHIELILKMAQRHKKRVSIHIDQENNPNERETELLAQKTIEFGLEGKVLGVHAVSLAAQEPKERARITKLLKEAGISIVVCPGAAISMQMLPLQAPLHNAIAPVPELLKAGVNVCLGTDNILDPVMPVADGDLWFETRLLMEANRFYNLNQVAKIASVNGLKALGL